MKNLSFLFVTLAMVLTFTSNTFAQKLNPLTEAEALLKLKEIEQNTKDKTRALFKLQLLAYQNVARVIPLKINPKDEKACLAKRVSACEKMADNVRNLTSEEFIKAGVQPYPNEYSEFYENQVSLVESIRMAISKPTSEEYDISENKILYLISRAALHEKTTNDILLSSIILFSVRAELQDPFALTTELLVIKANEQANFLVSMFSFVLDEEG